ncbi:MAG: PAS domain-containing protein, partial [Ginsengibacter sp.]
MNISIKAKIYWSFFILVLVFVLNAIITFNALHSYKQSANHFSNVTDPSLQKLGDLNKMLIESKMYTTNWVFLRSNQEDKASLLKIHNVDYQVLKSNLNILSSQWKEKPWIDSLQEFYTRFESLLVIEKKIMGSLQKFEDYDDPVLKMEAEQMVEDELIPRTVQLTASLNKIIHHQQDNRNIQETSLMGSTIKLRILIGVLAIVIICVGIFLSIYLTNIIISPMKKIRLIINNLGKGITGTIEDYTGKDEIAGMVLSVNNLSEKIRATAIFAEEIGNRNFTTSFQALSDEDTLGRALITMRDNIKSGDEKLNDAQHIAHIGSWERDVKTDYMQFSDEMFVIFDIDPLSFDFQFQSIIKFIHPDDIEYMSRVSRENQYLPPVPYECRIITAKGVMKNIWVETKVVLGKHGEIEKTFGIVQDITERKIAAKKLEDANRELSILFNSIDEIFFSVNMTTLKVIQISPMCENLYGYTQSEFLDNYMLWIEIIHPDDKHLIENEDEEMLRGEQINNQYRIIRKDKSIRWVETKITPTLDNARNL